MFPFLETIRLEQGQLLHGLDHQQRMHLTLQRFGSSVYIDLPQVFAAHALPADTAVYKARLLYDLAGHTHITIEPYQWRAVQTVQLVPLPLVDYSVKYADREWINTLLRQAGTDDILFHDRGEIRDTSYANVAFFNGKNWYTPAVPLLPGTHRARLIREHRLIERVIHVQELHTFEEMRWVNAMMPWETATRIGSGVLKQLQAAAV